MENNHIPDSILKMERSFKRKNFYIVGVGASAGGLEAIHELFDHFPNDTNLSFIIIQHLSSDYKSLLAELIAKHTKMKVAEAIDKLPVLPNHIYVIPNKKLLFLKHGRLRLKEKNDAVVPNNAIDIFFEALADEMGDHAIGIILSGTGTDGTKGFNAIKKAGGFTIVQDPKTAKFDGMPNSVISADVADLIASPRQMPELVLNYIKKGFKHRELRKFDNDDTDSASLESILAMVKQNTNQDFSNYKKPTIVRRIEKRMLAKGIKDMSEYNQYLQASPEEIDKLSKDFLIGVTRFFRDKEAFGVLAEQVIPALVASKQKDDVLKVWVAACSMGEEAYSIAILVDEYLRKNNLQVNVKIFASDIDKEAIDFASKGKYSTSIEQEVSKEQLDRYFTKENDLYWIDPLIRKMVIFTQHDVTKDPPFSRMDIVSCRNMLIYLEPHLQQKVLSSFNFSLNVGGYLFLGPSEHPGEIKNDLIELDKKHKIYKKAKASSTGSLYLMDSFNFKPPAISTLSNYKAASIKPKIADIFAETLSEEFGTAGIVIDGSYHIVQGIGDYHRFLKLPDKDLSFNLLKMVPEELSYVLSSAIRKAQSKKEKVQTGVKIKKGLDNVIISAIVKMIDGPNHFSQGNIFILLKEEKADRAEPSRIEFIDKNTESSRRIEDLEFELKETKQNLQTVVEELETSNEELQSSNEELISANEELQSTNEELQSLNEELHTVNTEHQLKIKELVELNDDLNNFFRSSDIGQVFLDKNLIIRKFTPSTKDLINLIETDIGRPISHISNNFKNGSFLNDINSVIDTSHTIEKEVELKNGRFYLTRILPYIRQDKRTDGVVITFFDITDLKNINSVLSAVLNSSLSGIMALKPIYNRSNKISDFEFIMSNQAIENLLGRNNLNGERLLLTLPEFKVNGLFDKYVDVVTKGMVLHEEYNYETTNGPRWIESIAVKMETGLAVTLTDIQDKKIAEEKSKTAYDELKKIEESLISLNNELEGRVISRTKELTQSEERFRLISQATNDAIWDWNLVTNQRWWNDGFKKIFGYEEDTEMSTVESWAQRIHENDRERVIKSIYDAIDYGSRLWSAEYKFYKADGSYAYILDRGEVLHDENGVPYRMLGSMVDLTESKKAEEALYAKNKELVKINDLLDTFVYTAAHDLKSPVANLKILVDLIKEKGEASRKELLAAIDLSVKRLDNTINGLVEIVEARSVDTDKIRKISFNELVTRILDENKNQVQALDANIHFDFSKAPSVVYIEAYLLSIINNLVANALKYSSKERPVEIKMETMREKDFIVFCISDNGIGMDLQKYGKNLFKPFNRFAKHIEGTGIGLYIIKNMIENNDGRMEVESKLNEGTTFKAYLREYTIHE